MATFDAGPLGYARTDEGGFLILDWATENPLATITGETISRDSNPDARARLADVRLRPAARVDPLCQCSHVRCGSRCHAAS